MVFKTSSLALIAYFILIVDCIPTSVLINTKGEGKENKKFLDTAASEQKEKSIPKKRGVPSADFDFLPNDFYLMNQNNKPVDNSWDSLSTEDLEKAYYDTIQSPYENLQNIIGTSSYSEPVALPLTYQNYNRPGYYRRKRSNSRKLSSFRPKRDSSKLSPADALALLDLIEAQEEQRRPSQFDRDFNPYQYLSADDYDINGNDAWMNAAVPEPRIQLLPGYLSGYEPKSEFHFKNRDSYNPSKRFMVAKKKRSLQENRDWRMGLKATNIRSHPEHLNLKSHATKRN